jgi:hypothetical protein
MVWFHSGQSEVKPLEAERELGVIDAHEFQNQG